MSLKKAAPKRTVVLLSRENFVWHSMQEIVPMIEQTWLGSRREGVHEVRSMEVDGAKLADYLPWLLEADQIVFACFTVKLCRLARLLRESLRLDARYVIYLHNQATIGCWPYHVWGLGEVLRTDDVFVSSCKLDAQTLPLSFTDARVERIPFTLPDADSFPGQAHPSARSDGDMPFVYVGRISAQKNLHLLLHAFSIFLDRNPGYRGELLFYGGEDQLGSPNMGLRQEGYLDFLRRLGDPLGISGRVRFLGHFAREELGRQLAARRHVFVSPSLHSDENFGMAAFRSLCLGQTAALSHWGGHADLATNFAGRAFTTPVKGASSGPWLSPYRFAETLGQAWRAALADGAPGPVPRIPEFYHPARISKALLALATEPAEAPGAALIPSEAAQRVLAQREKFSRSGADPCQIFTSYADPEAARFFRGYGMTPADEELSTSGDLRLVLWGRIEEARVRIDDPHRGPFSTLTDPAGPFAVVAPDGKSARVSEAQARFLLNEGLAYFVEDGK